MMYMTNNTKLQTLKVITEMILLLNPAMVQKIYHKQS